ncbi:MAG: hypothetical protein CJBNEKGG_04189 [Prosthecobacter sp.]|nr:hypothetical protein [Prosthecobacter sp.]
MSMTPASDSPPEPRPGPKKPPFSLSFLTKNIHDVLIWLLLLAAFRVVPYLIQKVDPTSAVSDFGMVHVLIYGALGTSFAVLTVWLIFHFSFPTLAEYIDGDSFKNDFKNIPAPHRIWVVIVVMSVLVWCFVKITALGAGADA